MPDRGDRGRCSPAAPPGGLPRRRAHAADAAAPRRGRRQLWRPRGRGARLEQRRLRAQPGGATTSCAGRRRAGRRRRRPRRPHRASATPCSSSAAGPAAAPSSPGERGCRCAQQPIRSDGTWLAPWLLTPGWSTPPPARCCARLRHPRRRGPGVQPDPGEVLPRPVPDRARGTPPGAPRAAATPRPAALRRVPRGLHARERRPRGHETKVAWFPGGTVTPVGPLPRI